MLISKKLTIDFVNQSLQRTVYAVQCDCNTRAAVITLMAAGVPWNPPEGAAASLTFKKPDGNKGWYDQLPDGERACTVDGNVVTAILAPEVLTVPGRVNAAVVFQDADLNQLSTFGFTIDVAPNPAAGNVISNSYYKYSTMADVNAAMELLDHTIAELEAARANGEFKGDTGEPGPQGPQGEKGEAPDAVLYTAQTLTDEQKAQARENIGAAKDTLIVTITGDIVQERGTSSHTPAQMLAHFKSGGNVILWTSAYNEYIPLNFVDEYGATAFLHGDNGAVTKITIDTDRSAAWSKTEHALKSTVDALDTQLGDIETALDSILAMQEELIGGERE